MFKRVDWIILIAVLLLSLVGIFVSLSVSINRDGTFDFEGNFSKQIMFTLIGIVSALVLCFLDLRNVKFLQISIPLYVFSVLLLVATVFFGTIVNNAKRWIDLGFFQLQPSEISKIAVIFLTASIISLKSRYNSWILVLISFITIIPTVILIFIQPHGAMSLIIIALWGFTVITALDNQLRNFILIGVLSLLSVGILLIGFGNQILGIGFIIVCTILFIFLIFSKIDYKKALIIFFLLGMLLGGGSLFITKNLLYEHQRERIATFLGISDDSSGVDFNVDQSIVAVGSGKLFGKGFGQGSQSRMRFLPEYKTDFIFAALSEEFGFFGSFFLIALFIVLILRIEFVAMSLHESFFPTVVVAMLGIKILLEVFINLGTNIGAVPATGIPLPLISYGGTITIMTWVTIGIIMSLIIHEKDSKLIDNYGTI